MKGRDIVLAAFGMVLLVPASSHGQRRQPRLQLNSYVTRAILYEPIYFRLVCPFDLGAQRSSKMELVFRQVPTAAGKKCSVPIQDGTIAWKTPGKKSGTWEYDIVVLLDIRVKPSGKPAFVLDHPGSYEVWAEQGAGGARTRTLRVEVDPPPEEFMPAVKAYTRMDVIVFGLTGKPFGDALDKALWLLKEFPRSPYSSWLRPAVGAASFKSVFDKHNIGGPAGAYRALYEYLGAAADRPERSAVNEQALFHLAYAQALAKDYGLSLATADRMIAKYPGSRLSRRTAKLKAEILAMKE